MLDSFIAALRMQNSNLIFKSKQVPLMYNHIYHKTYFKPHIYGVHNEGKHARGVAWITEVTRTHRMIRSCAEATS